MRINPESIINLANDMCIEAFPTGSKYFNSDSGSVVDDWYLFCPISEAGVLTDWLACEGFNQCPDTRTREFTSYENDRGITIYICWNEQFFHKFRLATRVCKSNGNLAKATREGSVNVFRTIFNFG